MEMTMLLWLYAISSFFSATTLLRQRGAADRRGLISVIAVGAVSGAGVLFPQVSAPAFWAGTAGFVLFLLLPGLLVRLGRQFGARGAFAPAATCLHVAAILFPAAGFRSERDLYRALRDHGGRDHPVAAEVQAKIAALSSGPMHREAPATLALIVVILACFGAQELWGDSRSLLTLLEFGANHAPLVSEGEVYRLLTAVFLHSGWLHLIFNVGALWVLGRWVEPELGGARTLIVFFVSGLAGNVASLALYWSAEVVGAGASGGAMGLIGCATMMLLRSGGDPHRARRLPSLMLIIFATLLVGAMVPGIDNGAHVGGLVAGGLLGLLFTRVSRFPDRAMRGVAAVFCVLTVVSAILVVRDLPQWRGLAPLDTPEFTLEHAVAAEVRVNEKCFELDWHLIGNLSIELVSPPGDGARWLREKYSEVAGKKPAGLERTTGASRGWRAAGDQETEHHELYLLENPTASRAALLTFRMPGEDPIIRERWVAPVVASFRFR